MSDSSWSTDAAALLLFAHRLADASGEAILPHFREAVAIGDKGAGSTFDPVTAADRDAEKELRFLISQNFPDHGIIGEEFGEEGGDREYCWVLDPIDGTRAFIMGLPVWGTLIGLRHHGRPALGLMNQPFTGERFWSDGRNSYFRRGGVVQQISVRECARLDAAMLAATTPHMFSPGVEQDRFNRLSATVRLTRFGGDCYSYCLLAMGFIDLVVEADLKPFDIIPLIPIIECAGGRVSNWSGDDAYEGGRIVAAGDPRLHEAVLEILAA